METTAHFDAEQRARACQERETDAIRMTMLVSSLGRIADLGFKGPHGDHGLPAVLPLPDWARFLSLATTRIATAGGGPVVAVFSLPTRSWAASIMLASAVVDEDAVSPSTPRDLSAHVKGLRELADGAPVRVFEPRKDGTLRVRDASWRGIGPSKYPKFATDDRIRFELRGQGYRELKVGDAQRVHPVEQRPDRARQTYSLTLPPLVRAVLGDGAALGYVTADRCSVVAVGTVNLLAEELSAEVFCAHRDPTSHGTLQDLARTQNLPCAGRGRRAILISSRSRPRAAQQELEPRLVIYDGGGAFFGWGTRWPDARKIVLVDRSVASAADVAAELNSAAACGDRDADVLGGLKVPAGIESIVFRGEL